MIANYHTHTMRCKHAVGTDEEYVLEAIKHGYKVLAFTDHSPWPRSIRVWDDHAEDMSREIIKCAKQQGVYLEFNLGGMRSHAGYPYLPFWKIVAQEKAPTLIGIDAHSPSDLSDVKSINEARKILKDLNIKVTDKIAD